MIIITHQKMSFMNKVGSMLNKKVGSIGSKKGEANTYKPAGVHVLGEDYFPQDNIMINEDSIETNNSDFEKSETISESNSSNLLPSVTKKKEISSSMQDIFGISKQNLPQKKNKQDIKDSDFMKGFNLINGEKTIQSDKCNIEIDKELIPCKVLITNYRVYIIPDFKKKPIGEFSYYNYFPENFFSLLIHKMDKVTKTSNEKSFVFSIEIHMKDERIITLIFKGNNGDSFLDRLNGLLHLKETPSYSNLAFEYRKNHPIYKKPNFEDGWNLYNPEEEYARQGLTNLDYDTNRNRLFRKTKLNENYSLCATYPKFLITVGEITDSDYKCSSEFRTKNRLPTLAYYHHLTKGTIWRSAQTKSGITGNRNRFDEDLLLDIAKISETKKAYIYDCRPYLSAMANKLKGAGFENIENYPGAEIIFCEIDHIHSARNSLHKIYSMLKYNRFSEDKKFLSNFENSGWPNFIYGIIRASINIASSVRRGYSVLIHCSDGWDRCSQLTAFSQLLVDPYFRTIKGYMTLIEKDFLSYGHQFRFRNGYYSKGENNENQNSPILLQYLDATHQLLVQYPMYFEFNMKFLLFIANNINSGLYGTFLYNSEKEREQKNAKNNTMSCWTEILNNINQYKNQFYEEKTRKEFFFTPIFPFSRIRLWEEFFLPLTQININISYDNYINRFHENFYYNIFGQIKQKNRIISNVMFIDREKDNYEKNIDKLQKENQKLKMALSELTINNNLNKVLYESLSKQTIGVINNIAKEHGGEIGLNSELNMYVYHEVKKPKKKEEEIKKEEINKKEEENIKEEIKEEKIEKKDENKEQKKVNKKIGQDKIDMFFGKIKTNEEKKIVIKNKEEIKDSKKEGNNSEIDNINKKEDEDKKENEDNIKGENIINADNEIQKEGDINKYIEKKGNKDNKYQEKNKNEKEENEKNEKENNNEENQIKENEETNDNKVEIIENNKQEKNEEENNNKENDIKENEDNNDNKEEIIEKNKQEKNEEESNNKENDIKENEDNNDNKEEIIENNKQEKNEEENNDKEKEIKENNEYIDNKLEIIKENKEEKNEEGVNKQEEGEDDIKTNEECHKDENKEKKEEKELEEKNDSSNNENND